MCGLSLFVGGGLGAWVGAGVAGGARVFVEWVGGGGGCGVGVGEGVSHVLRRSVSVGAGGAGGPFGVAFGILAIWQGSHWGGVKSGAGILVPSCLSEACEATDSTRSLYLGLGVSFSFPRSTSLSRDSYLWVLVVVF